VDRVTPNPNSRALPSIRRGLVPQHGDDGALRPESGQEARRWRRRRSSHRIVAPRVFKNVEAVRTPDRTHLVLFESDAFSNHDPYGGQITPATLDGNRVSELKILAAGLNDP
jgi:hypothetical protein